MLRTGLFFISVLLIFLAAPAFTEEGRFRFSTDPAIKQVEPRKPIKIKLKRKENGKYTWELVGDDAEEVISVDRRLREYLGARQ